MKRFIAVLEVTFVTFIITPLLTISIYKLFPDFETWQVERLGFPFPVFNHVVMAGVAILAILLHHKRLVDYGIVFKPLNYHLGITAACFIPVVLAGIPLGMGFDHTRWSGALVLAAVQIGLLVVLALILRKKPSQAAGTVAVGLLLVPPELMNAIPTAWKAIALFLTYALFVGFGEEILYRGYMQSRLNEAFGKPYRFFGIAFGWGAIITALLFGLTHVGILSWILGLSTKVTVAWGFWTFFGGLVFGLVREKSGSILAPALLHGVPQAIAVVVMLFL